MVPASAFSLRKPCSPSILSPILQKALLRLINRVIHPRCPELAREQSPGLKTVWGTGIFGSLLRLENQHLIPVPSQQHLPSTDSIKKCKGWRFNEGNRSHFLSFRGRESRLDKAVKEIR